MEHERKGLTLFVQLLLFLLGIVIVISGSLTLIFSVYSKRALEQHSTEDILRQLDAISSHLRIELQKQLLNDLRILSSSPVLDALMTSSDLEKEINARAVERLFLESTKYIDNYESIFFADSFGRETIKVNRAGRVRQYRDMGQSPLFRDLASASSGDIRFELPRPAADGGVSFSIGINKRDADIGRFGGALIVRYSMQDLLAYVGRIRIFGENPIWVFAADGMVLMQPRAGSAQFDPRPYFADGMQPEPRLVKGNDGMLIYGDFLLLPGRPLLRVAISIPTSLLLHDVRSILRFFTVVFLVSVVIVFLIAYSYAIHVSRPIEELARAAARLAKGDLSMRVAVRSAGEINMLVNSFNRMAADLQQTTVSKRYVDDIIGNMRDALIVASPGGLIIRVNTAACYLFGQDETELLGMQIDQMVIDAGGNGASTVSEVLNNASISSVEKTCLTRQGRRVPVLFSASTMQDSEGAVHGIVCVARDISKKKRAEEQLQRSSEELREVNEELKSFAYIVSHDLRAPLVNIRGFSDELERSIAEIGPCLEKHLPVLDEAETKRLGPLIRQDIPEALSFIRSSVARMDNQISAILKLSRTGRRKLIPEPLRTKEFVQGILNTLAHQIGSRKVTVTTGDLPDLVADRTAMEQVFGNLLDNAVKYLDPDRPGAIAVAAEERDEEIVFQVKDNGRGMAKEDIPKAFEIFRRVGKQDVPGEGLGLAYVKTVVRSMGGRIWCESEPGRGTTFSFTVPRAMIAPEHEGVLTQ
jgi:PAS domain S-box-containing protein